MPHEIQKHDGYVIIKLNDSILDFPALKRSFSTLIDLIVQRNFSNYICDMTEVQKFEVINSDLRVLLNEMMNLLKVSPKTVNIHVATSNDYIIRSIGRCFSTIRASGLPFVGNFSQDIETAVSGIKS